MTKEQRIAKILEDYQPHIEAQIKKGFTSGMVLGHFRWQNASGEIVIDLFN